MSLRTSLLAVAEVARALSGPLGVDIRTNHLTIRTRVWSGDYLHEGTASDSDLILPAHYPIRYVSGEEVSGSGGGYHLEDLAVRHITPSNGAGVGYTPAQLKPPITNEKTEVIYVITGPLDGEYDLVDLRAHRPFSYDLILRRRLTTP